MRARIDAAVCQRSASPVDRAAVAGEERLRALRAAGQQRGEHLPEVGLGGAAC